MKFKFFCIAFLYTEISLAGAEHIILDESVKKAYQEQSEVYKINRPTLIFDNKQSVNNCDEYLKKSAENTIVETVNNQLTKSSYIVCDAIDLIRKSKTYSESYERDQLGKSLFASLDLSTFPNSVARQVNGDDFFIQRLNLPGTFINEFETGIDNKNVFLNIKVIAIVQANDNDQPDWVVQFVEEVKTGNYRHYGTFLILDPEKKKVLSASSVR